jgi:hypothetical protein
MPLVARWCLLPLIAVAPVGAAQDDVSIPWAYGAYFGTGYYELGTGEDTYVLSARPRWTWREAGFDAYGKRKVGVEFRVPVTIGAYQVDAADLGGTLNFDNVSTISGVPGVEIEVPISERWSLKPLGYVGWGTQIDGDSSAWIYWGGLKSQLRFGDEDFEWGLVNSLVYVGYSSKDAENGSALPLLTAFEFSRPIGDKKIAGHPVRLHWHVGYTAYLNEVILNPGTSSISRMRLDTEWELGAAFSTGDEPLRLWRFKWDRVGLVYRFSGDGDFHGIGIEFHSLFDR